MRTTQVLIVGAGPSGLVLANVLAAHGVDCEIIDRKPGPVEQSRAALVHVRTLELLNRLGVAARMVANGTWLNHADFRQRGRRLAKVPLRHPEAAGRFPAPLVIEQGTVEHLLTDRLAELGRQVTWRSTLTELAQDEAETTAVVTNPDGARETIVARWAVGADGGGSTVRKALGLGFGGRTYQQTGLVADVELNFEPGTTVDDDTLRLDLTGGGFVGMFHFPNGLWRLFGAVPPELAAPGGDESHEPYAEVDARDLDRWLKEYFGVPATLERVAWSALFRVHSRLTENFQVGNTFLVGDAAHLHSPAGGQGMNLGIGDAINLGWKLALVAAGQARTSLLESYPAERRPVAERVLSGTDRGFALEATANRFAVWARAHLLAHLIRPLLHRRRVQHAIFGLFSQTWIRYRKSPAVSDHRFPAPIRPGDRAPNGVFKSPGNDTPEDTFALMHELRHDLLIFEGATPLPALDTYHHQATNITAGYAVNVAVHVVKSGERDLHREYGATAPSVFLIRPDGHIAHASSITDLDTLAHHLDKLYQRIPTNTSS